MFVADNCANNVKIFPPAGSGNIAPEGVIGSNAQLADPTGVAVANSNFYVSNECNNSVSIYPIGSQGSGAPRGRIIGPSTGLSGPSGVALTIGVGAFWVANEKADSLTEYPLGVGYVGDNDVPPIMKIEGSNTGLDLPNAIAADSVGNIYVTNLATNSVTIYSSGNFGNLPPIATIVGPNTMLDHPDAIAVDSNGVVYVGIEGPSSQPAILEFAPNGGSPPNGNIAPTTVIAGSNTNLTADGSIVVDSAGNIYVSRSVAPVYSALPPQVLVFTAGSSGNVAPGKTISGSSTQLVEPEALALDSSNNLYVSDELTASVLTFGAGAGGNVAPATVVGQVKSALAGVTGVALDNSHNVYVSNANGFVSEFAHGTTGDVAPIATIAGATTTLVQPQGIAVDKSANIYVTDITAAGVASVAEFAAGSTGNVAPQILLGGTNTGLSVPQGVAVDGSGNIYVSDLNSSVKVFSAGQTGNVAPASTIAGGNTGLILPDGITLGSNGTIYVADAGGSNILGFASGSSGNVSPIFFIGGSSSLLYNPEGVALDSAGNVYVADTTMSGPGSAVYVFLAGNSGDSAPDAVIAGPKTNLARVSGIAIGGTQ